MSDTENESSSSNKTNDEFFSLWDRIKLWILPEWLKTIVIILIWLEVVAIVVFSFVTGVGAVVLIILAIIFIANKIWGKSRNK